MTDVKSDRREDLANYLCNISIIMDSRERTGIDRGGSNLWLANEYHRAYAEYKALVKGEQDSEPTTTVVDGYVVGNAQNSKPTFVYETQPELPLQR